MAGKDTEAEKIADAVAKRVQEILNEYAENCRLDGPGVYQEFCGCWDVLLPFVRWAERGVYSSECETWLGAMEQRTGIPRRDLLAGVVRQWLVEGLEAEMRKMSRESVVPPIP